MDISLENIFQKVWTFFGISFDHNFICHHVDSEFNFIVERLQDLVDKQVKNILVNKHDPTTENRL